MDIDTARTRLARMTAAGTDPTVDNDTLDDILAGAAVIDDNGREPADPDWAGAWDLNEAAAETWAVKAAAAATAISFTADGATFQRDAVFRHCMRMVEFYTARTGTDIAGRTTPTPSGWTQASTVYTGPFTYPSTELLP